MKKLVSAMLAAMLLVGSLASCAAGLGDPGAIDNYTPEVKTLTTDKGVFTFEEGEGGTAILVSYAGKATKDDRVEIPATFKDREVTAIGDRAFYNLAAVVDVKIPDTVISIGEFAFASCTELVSVQLPDGLEKIGRGAFEECSKLETVGFGKSLVEIEEFAFFQCTALKNFTLPNTLETIGDAAFWKCTAMTSLTIPESVKTVGQLVFYECSGLTSIRLHNGIEKIGSFCFNMNEGTLKSAIDTSNLTEDSVIGKFVASMDDSQTTEKDDTSDTSDASAESGTPEN